MANRGKIGCGNWPPPAIGPHRAIIRPDSIARAEVSLLPILRRHAHAASSIGRKRTEMANREGPMAQLSATSQWRPAHVAAVFVTAVLSD